VTEPSTPKLPPRVPFVPVRAPRAMVTSVDPLASDAGIAMIRAGGTAADAAVAANAVLAVTTQNMCGMGGDLFAVVAEPGGEAPFALNASGRAGSGADAAALRREGFTRMPFRGDIRSVTIPGCVDGWCALHARFGALPLGDVLAPAIEYARSGFPVSPLLASACTVIADVAGNDDYRGVRAQGDLVRRPGIADALVAVAAGGRDAWYGGAFGRELIGLGRGLFAADDLAGSQADWVTPIRARVWDHDVWTVPPNSQAYITLAAAAVAARLALPDDPDDPQWAHVLIEAAKAAGADRPAVLHEGADGDALCSPSRLERFVAAVDEQRASAIVPPVAGGGTIHLNAVDRDGLTVSLTQSNCAGFGAHIAVPGLRVFLQNRGMAFSLEPGHPAEFAPGRRPPHTLCPTLVTRADGSPRFTLGTMGADSQPMIVLQLLARLLHGGQDVATAVASGRWILAAPTAQTFAVWDSPDEIRVRVEGQAPLAWSQGLRERGHDVEIIDDFAYVAGHAHVVEIGPDGLAGAADPRALTAHTATL
jgi:gamma-glutamyltranspeptidase/glutathione hydrolase